MGWIITLLNMKKEDIDYDFPPIGNNICIGGSSAGAAAASFPLLPYSADIDSLHSTKRLLPTQPSDVFTLRHSVTGDLETFSYSELYDGRALSGNLVTNGDFSDGTTGWVSTGGGSISEAGGELVITGGGSFSTCSGAQSLSTEIGSVYKICAKARRGTSSNNAEVNVSNNSDLVSAFFSVASTGDYFKEICGLVTATSTTTYLGGRLAGVSDGLTVIFDDFEFTQYQRSTVEQWVYNPSGDGTTVYESAGARVVSWNGIPTDNP